MIGRLFLAGPVSDVMVVTSCTSCGDASGWLRFGPTWGACGLCNDDAAKPLPPWCGRCGQTFPCCSCERAKA